MLRRSACTDVFQEEQSRLSQRLARWSDLAHKAFCFPTHVFIGSKFYNKTQVKEIIMFSHHLDCHQLHVRFLVVPFKA